ncbi:cAMP phosphodiesterase [Cyanobium sp. HWJ4-Hawea]|uniref:cAMP phosphodiesterase n=1 Tax=Cyanobium sp. HWJ4-Hawea TaxID=2823713 RepID=UPI0020CEAB69|nr:cAMP phosphodiesterase [Cyanobium sp. HWJ4-Hawea]
MGAPESLALISLLRRCRPNLAASLLVVPLLALPLLGLPLLMFQAPAQAAPGQAEVAGAPATEADMNLYTRIAAVNVCIARGAGVEFDKAVGIAGETIAQLILGQHGGSIAQVGPSPLTIDQLRKGSINSAVLGAVEICPKEVPADVIAKVQAALKAQQGGTKAPAPKTPATKK